MRRDNAQLPLATASLSSFMGSHYCSGLLLLFSLLTLFVIYIPKLKVCQSPPASGDSTPLPLLLSSSLGCNSDLEDSCSQVGSWASTLLELC